MNLLTILQWFTLLSVAVAFPVYPGIRNQTRVDEIRTPTCTWISNYTISHISCGTYLQFQAGEPCSVGLGEEAEIPQSQWFVSAFATQGVDPTQGNITVLQGQDICPASDMIMYTTSDEGVPTLVLGESGEGLVRIMPVNASDGCSQIYLINEQGAYLDATCDGNLSFSTDPSDASLWVAENVGYYPTLDNHEFDKDISTAYEDQNVTFYHYTSNGKTGTTEFPEGIVKVGTNDENRVLSFICPQSSEFGIFGEVQIENVGGAVDPNTGAASVQVSDVYWLLWGRIPILNFTLEKENAAKINLYNGTMGTFFDLDNIYAPDMDTLFNLGVSGTTGEPVPESTPDQLRFIKEANLIKGNVFANGTKVYWEINLMSPEKTTGAEYAAYAESLNQGQNVGGTAPDPIAAAAAAQGKIESIFYTMMFVIAATL